MTDLTPLPPDPSPATVTGTWMRPEPMIDRLTEAYRLLGNDIPPGLGYVGHVDGYVEWGVGPYTIPPAVAEWGLIVAVEGVLKRSGWCLWWDDGLHQCRREIAPLVTHPDRLQAAILALRAERSKP